MRVTSGIASTAHLLRTLLAAGVGTHRTTAALGRKSTTRMALSATVGRVSLLVLGVGRLGIPSWGADEPVKTGTFLEVMAVDPTSPATLKAGNMAKVKIRYHCATAKTVRIWAQPYTKGSCTADAFWEPSAVESNGMGELERFVVFYAPARVDELRVSMVNAKTNGREVLDEVSHPVDLKWGGFVFGRVDPVGKTFPDLSFTSIQGDDVNLAAMKGKVVLLHFWSGYSSSFRRELPYLIAVHDRYHANGFEIVGINLDGDNMAIGRLAVLEQVRAAKAKSKTNRFNNLDTDMPKGKAGLQAYIKVMGMTWPQYYDGKGLGNNEIVKDLGLTRVYCSYLIDRQGVVRHYNTEPKLLEEAVEKLIAEDPQAGP